MADQLMRVLFINDIQTLLTIARSRYGYLLNTSNSTAEIENKELNILGSVVSIHDRILHTQELSKLPPGILLNPFLVLIRHEHSSSSLTSAALRIIQHFVYHWPWTKYSAIYKFPSQDIDIVSEIVDAVSQCRYQETNAESDEQVLVLVIHVLHDILKSNAVNYLSDHSMWQLVESLYAFSRSSRQDILITVSLRTTATKFLHDAITMIFQSPSVYANTTLPATSNFGLPCAVKIIGFLCQKIHARVAPPIVINPNSIDGRGQIIAALSDNISSSHREVYLCFSLLYQALISSDTEMLLAIPSIVMFIKDDLCLAILRYSRLGACSDFKIPQLCMNIFRLLWSRPQLSHELKIQVEAIWNCVFFHALHWIIDILSASRPYTQKFPITIDDTHAVAAQASTTSALEKSRILDRAQSVEISRNQFTGGMVSDSKLLANSFELVQYFVHLMAEPSLLHLLFVSFDCSEKHCDVVRTTMSLLTQVMKEAHQTCVETNDEGIFLWAQACAELAAKGLYNSVYVLQQAESSLSNKSLSTDANISAFEQMLNERRKRKKMFLHGIQQFNKKSIAGIKYLQEHSFLPTPCTPKALTQFLRSLPPTLTKQAVGMYLGAIGKDVKDFEKLAIHEADTMDFHREVLELFVDSFSFDGESIVTALRMFLSSFRLPGEAQQIDRILNCFSLKVYNECREKNLWATHDVAYLLSFSLIMLNTDLHNPNIRPEKKMTLEAFIRNNTNYGEEVSKGQSLPDYFLKDLYEALATEQIRTTNDTGKQGEVTVDRWKDLLRHCDTGSFCLDYEDLADNKFKVLIAHFYKQIYHPVVEAFNSVFMQYVNHSNARDRSNFDSSNVQVDDLVEDHGLQYLPEKNLLQLACNGLVLCSSVASQLDCVTEFNDIFIQLCRFTALISSAEAYTNDYTLRENGLSLFGQNQSAAVATIAVLNILNSNCQSLESLGWRYFFQVLSALRVFRCLPYSVLYPSKMQSPSPTIPLLTIPQRQAFLDQIEANRLELEKRLRLQREATQDGLDSDGTSPSSDVNGMFFSSVQWLMSALSGSPTTSNTASDMYGIRRSNSGRGTSRRRYTILPANLTDLHAFCTDFMLPPLSKKDLEDQSGKSLNADEIQTNQSSGIKSTEINSKVDKNKAVIIDLAEKDAWIPGALQSYRLEQLVPDVANLEARALVHIMDAVEEEFIVALSDSSHSAQQAPQAKPSSIILTVEQDFAHSQLRTTLPPCGIVLLEHLLSEILRYMSIRLSRLLEHSIYDKLELHYSNTILLLQPMLLDNRVVNGVTYDTSCIILSKILDGVIALIMGPKETKERGGRILFSLIQKLWDMTNRQEEFGLLYPFLPQLLAALHHLIGNQTSEWTHKIHLVMIVIEQSSRSLEEWYNGFLLLDNVIKTSNNANLDIFESIYRQLLAFAVLFTNSSQSVLPNDQEAEICARNDVENNSGAIIRSKDYPFQLLTQILVSRWTTNLPTIDIIESSLRIRMLGGIFFVVKYVLHLRNRLFCKLQQQTSNEYRNSSSIITDDDQYMTENQLDMQRELQLNHFHSLNSLAVTCLECVTDTLPQLQMGTSSDNTQRSDTELLWAILLSEILIPMAMDVLCKRENKLSTERSTDEILHQSPAKELYGGVKSQFSFYYEHIFGHLSRNSNDIDDDEELMYIAIPAREELESLSRATAQTSKSKILRRRLPSVSKDKHDTVRSQVLVVEIIVYVICEHIDILQDSVLFQHMWSQIVTLIVEILDETQTQPSTKTVSAPQQENVHHAIDRRLLGSAHDEILEHIKGLVRRLIALQSNISESFYLTTLKHEILVAKGDPEGIKLLEHLFPPQGSEEIIKIQEANNAEE